MKFIILISFLALAACAGPKGAPGIPGINGRDGTVINLVKLCPDMSAYPNTFPEYAMCIDNKLYGVYSANGGFLTYLPDGQYSSNGINSSCTFTISGCSIQ